ncbi:MAG: hypothetical protein RI564_13060 [Gracilimonas sp.]|nr:hypothetical protein [Gracilimonas sp.]
MRQIHQLARALERVIAVVVGLKRPHQTQDVIQTTNQSLVEYLDIDIYSLIQMDQDKMIQKLEENPGMNHQNLEKVADLFLEMGLYFIEEETSEIEPHILFGRALCIFEYIESEGSIYSIDRNQKIRDISDLLSLY